MNPLEIPENLLRTVFPVSDVRRLPFVCDVPVAGKRRAERQFWMPEQAFPGFHPSEAGSLCGAAYLLFRAEEPSSHSHLPHIVRSMPGESSSAAIAFLSLLDAYANVAYSKFSNETMIRRYVWSGILRERSILERPENYAGKIVPAQMVRAFAGALGTTVNDLTT